MPTKQKIAVVILTVLSLGALVTFLLEWQYSPLNKAIAWYHLKTGGFATTQEATKYVTTLLDNGPISVEKLDIYPYLAVSEQITDTAETAKPYTTDTAEDPMFLAEKTYTFPFGQDGVYDLESHSLLIEGKEVSTFTVIGRTLTEPINQTVYLGKKQAEDIKKEVLAKWKLLVTALGKKEAKQAEELISFAETEKFAKTAKLSDLSYRLAPTPSVAFNVGAEDNNTIRIGTLSLKQKKCSVTAEIYIIYLKDQRVYRFDNVNAALSSMCTKPKPINSTTSTTLSCSNCWLAPVSKQYALPSGYSPYVVYTGLSGGGYVTPDTKSALAKLFADANINGITVRVSSSYRSYSTQASLFNTYVNNEKKYGLTTAQATEKANTYSAKPGHSEHQLGTTTDLMSCKAPCSFYDSANNALYTYLKNNAHKFGFVISYPNGSQPYTGYMYEPWHIRYVGSTYSNELYNRGYLTKSGYYLYQFLLEKGKY